MEEEVGGGWLLRKVSGPVLVILICLAGLQEGLSGRAVPGMYSEKEMGAVSRLCLSTVPRGQGV